MTENKSKTGTAEIVIAKKRRFLRLVQIFPDGSPRRIDNMEVPKMRKISQSNQPRWKDGSYLTTEQKVDENYQTKNKIA